MVKPFKKLLPYQLVDIFLHSRNMNLPLAIQISRGKK